MADHSEVVRGSQAHLDLGEVLKKPPSVLLGLSPAAEAVLKKLGIQSVFDLGASWLFANARAASRASDSDSLSARHGLAPTDWLQPTASWSALEKIATLGVENLRGIDPAVAVELKAALDVATIRDFANWPPQRAARQLLGESLGSSLDPDEVQTEKLRPRFGEFPTERVYYSTLVMLQMPPEGERLEIDGPLSLKPTVGSVTGFKQPAVGALLTFSQSWYTVGITLGHMLHSLALAPGEATRVAVIDWSRRARAASSESISESERLDNSTQHSRAMSEVQSAVAEEVQSGGSTSFSQSFSHSASEQSAVGTGFIASLFASGDSSSTYQSASSAGSANSSSWSLGSRAVTAGMAQNVNDRTEQHATSVRNRRATAVREVSQSEHEQVSTRIVANYNHMHALTVQYYEIVQLYRSLVELHRAERCLFLPLEQVDFSGPDAMGYVERFRGALVRAALNPRATELLLDTATSVSIEPVIPVRVAAFRPELVRAIDVSRLTLSTTLKLGLDAKEGVKLEAAAPAAVTPEASVTQKFRVWDDRELLRVSKILTRPLLRLNSDSLHFPDDTELLAVSFSGLSVKRVMLDRLGTEAAESTFDVPTDQGRLDLPSRVRLAELEKVHLAKSEEAAKSGTMTLECVYLGRRFSSPAIPIELSSGTGLQSAVNLRSDERDRRKELLAHLQANRAHYSQAIYRSLDSSAVVALVAQYNWNGRPLADQVEPKVLRVAGNFLVLRAPVESGEPSGVRNGDGQQVSWQDLLKSRGIELGQSDPRLIPIPTNGVFAEAVLGRSNAAEKLDITRFWNWQDSPIPLTPTEIAPITTGSRGAAEDLKPGQLSPPVLNIVNPTSLPDPAGVGAVLNAVSTANIFRDMSGLAGTQKLVEAGMAGTLSAATEAGQMASANLRTEAQKAVAMGQIAADIVKSVMGGGGGGGAHQSITGEGAHIAHAQNMDRRGVPGPGDNAAAGGGPPGIGSSGGGSSGGGSPASPGGGGAGGAGTGGGASGSPPRNTPYSHEAAATNRFVQGYSPETASALGGVVDSLAGALAGGSNPAPAVRRVNRAADLPQALALIDTFKNKTGAGRWPHLGRAAVADRLVELVNDPDKVEQGAVGLCGPAVFLNVWIAVDPLGFATFATDLYDMALAYIGSKKVNPDADLYLQDYTSISWGTGRPPVPQADWMVMSALRDSANLFLDYEGTPGESWAEGTSLGDIQDWLEATNLFSSVTREEYTLTDPDYSTVAALNPTNQRFITFFIRTRMIRAGRSGRHFINMRSNVSKNSAGNVTGQYWTWGTVETLDTPVDKFEDDLMGWLVATL